MDMVDEKLEMSNDKLVKEFGAVLVSKLKDLPKFYTFDKGLIHSHRDFDKFLKALKNNERCAIVSGFNASGTIHLGHKPVFDTNLYFQKEYGIPVFIPISDDESYVAGKVETQEEALENSLALAKELLAYGFDPHKTYFIIDQIYTNIYNLAIKLSKKVNLSEIKTAYGYANDDNIGLHFYPTIQAAHILFPQYKFGIKHTLVIIGPDEDAHIRICRGIASRIGYEKPSILHSTFMPGTDGGKMSKSKNNALFFNDNKKTIINKIGKAFSGGQKTVEEHRKIGGNPEVDVSCIYLSKYFLNEKEGKKLFEDYRNGKLLSGEVKKMLSDHLVKTISEFQGRVNKVNKEDLDMAIMKNQ